MFEDIELCPRWWRWPFPPRRFDFQEVTGPDPIPWSEIPVGGQLSLRMFRALTVYNMAYQYHDKEESLQLQRLALRQLEQLTQELQQVGLEQ